MTAGAVPPPPGSGLPGDDPWPDDDGVAGYEEDPRDAVPAAELAAWYAELGAEPEVPDPVIADPDAGWFAAGCPDAGVPAGVSVFCAGDPADVLGPGPLLAGLSDQAFGHGLTSLPDDALVGLLRASRRLAAWQDGVALAAVAELDACRRPARRCDLDHTRPWHDGGRTCECALAPLCRRHHRAKQGPGWHIEQPQPGTLIWTTPHGRRYTSTPDPYLT